MSTYTFKGKSVSPLDVATALGLTGLTGQPSIREGVDFNEKPIVMVDFPGVTLTSAQRLQLEEIAKTKGWGTGDPPPVLEEDAVLDALSHPIVAWVNDLLTARGLPPLTANDEAQGKSELKKLASRGRIS